MQIVWSCFVGFKYKDLFTNQWTMRKKKYTDQIVDVCHRETAQMLVSLMDLGVTHVLNAAQGNSRYHVNTSPVKYQKHNISFLGIEATDFMNFDMSPFFQQAADFIEEGLKDGMYLSLSPSIDLVFELTK